MINFLFAIVEVAWIPIFVIWWGYGYKTILIALTYVVFFPVLYNTLVGVRTVPQPLINAVRALGANRWQVLTNVVLPAALPSIITGLRVGAGFAFRGLIFAEIVAAKTGLGYLDLRGRADPADGPDHRRHDHGGPDLAADRSVLPEAAGARHRRALGSWSSKRSSARDREQGARPRALRARPGGLGHPAPSGRLSVLHASAVAGRVGALRRDRRATARWPAMS